MAAKTSSTAKRGGAASSMEAPTLGSHQRSPSPARILRAHEKEQLTQLNDRLASYIDRVRLLETENERLTVHMLTYTESSQKTVTDLRALYQAELAGARRLLDETSKENAKLQIELGKARADADELRVRFTKRDREASMAERHVGQLQTELAASRSERDILHGEFARTQHELDQLRKQYDTCKKQLEDETLLRVDMQNNIQTLKEEIHFNEELHAREIEKSMMMTNSTVFENQTTRYHSEYEAKLGEAIQELRDQYAIELQQTREDANAAAERRISDAQAVAERQGASASAAREEMLTVRRRCDELSSELMDAQQENVTLQKRISELEATVLRDRIDLEAQLAELRAEIERLQKERTELDEEYQDLYDAKVQLDYEISVYRKLLEAEEVRLNLSDSDSPVHKRRRVEFSEVDEPNASTTDNLDRADVNSYVVESTSKSNLGFPEVELGGARFIRLANHSAHDVLLGGATLHHHVGELDTTFKFSKQFVLKAGATVTVYGSDAGGTHSPPSELVMKNQKWTLGDEMRTLLINSKGDQLCSVHMRLHTLGRVSTSKKSTVTRRTSHHGSTRATSKSGSTDKSDQCALM